MKIEIQTYCVFCFDNFGDDELNEIENNPVCFSCFEIYEEENK